MEAKDLKNIVIKETKVDTVLTKSNLPIAGYSINPYVYDKKKIYLFSFR